MSTTPGLIGQTEARRLARILSQSTGMAHVAHTIPAGCWGGTEQGWAVSGPAAPATELGLEQALTRVQLIVDAQARLRQAERAQDWRAQLGELTTIDRLAELGQDHPSPSSIEAQPSP